MFGKCSLSIIPARNTVKYMCKKSIDPFTDIAKALDYHIQQTSFSRSKLITFQEMVTDYYCYYYFNPVVSPAVLSRAVSMCFRGVGANCNFRDPNLVTFLFYASTFSILLTVIKK